MSSPHLHDHGDRAGVEPHVVQFYETEAYLASVVADFLGEGLMSGEAAVAIAASSRHDAVLARLRDQGVDVDAACASGQLGLLDAERTLARFMIGGMPDRRLFLQTIEPVLDAVGGEGRPVRAYGEMVDVLWQAGNHAGALRLEELWNELQRGRPFRLLCAYVMASFYRTGGGLADVCGVHSHVHGAERADGEGASLQARALAAEIGQRIAVERALRGALHAQRESEARSRRLLRVTAAIADAITPDQVHEAVVDQVGAALGASNAALWVAAGDRARLVRAGGYSDVQRQRMATITAGDAAWLPVADALARGEPIWIDSRADLVTRYPAIVAVTSEERPYRAAALPLVVHGDTIGVLGLAFFDAPALDDDERGFLLLVARYAAQALERLRLLEAERASREDDRRARARAELLAGLARAVIVADSLDQVFAASLDAIAAGLGAARASILTFDDAGVMRFRAWRGLSDGYRAAVEGHSPWSRDARDPQPIAVADVVAEPSLAPYLGLFAAEGIGALAFIPLVDGQRLVGKFMVYFAGPPGLAADELSLARAIADQVAAGLSRFLAVAELRETVRWNELFTGILGHDLRNPLAAILTSAQIALETGDERSRRYLTRIVSSSERMHRMIEQLLDFTRLRLAGGIALTRAPLELVPLVRQVVDELEGGNPGRVRIEDTGDTAGTWDGDRLAQVFSNLVANALHHGGGTVDVTIDGTAPDVVRIETRNPGTIPADVRARIFEPLAGGPRRTGNARGLGLGLHITQQLVRAHGGDITMRSGDDGTVFSITLPR